MPPPIPEVSDHDNPPLTVGPATTVPDPADVPLTLPPRVSPDSAEGTQPVHCNKPSVFGLPEGLRNHPRYRILRELGRGGMGSVYLAEHILMGRTVALKTINLRLADDSAIVERFVREIRACSKLNHENVVTVYDAEQTSEMLFLVMEYLEGQTLRELVGLRHQQLDIPVACALIRQAVLGMQHAHEKGVVHRDIKPTNLVLTSGTGPANPGRVKVLDFGLAKVLVESGNYIYGTPAGYAMGTVGYMSPEQSADARSVGINADIFSLGRTLYYLLSGRHPHPDGVNSMVLEESGQQVVAPLELYRPDVPLEIVALVEKMSARRQEDRFQSCAEVLAALDPYCHV